MTRPADVWASGDAYEAYVGRWSRHVAAGFCDWLAVPSGLRWIDVGCGTGALTRAVLECAEPAEVVGIDSSAGFVETARARTSDPRARFLVGDATDVSGDADAVVSGLVLNFLPDHTAALAAMRAASTGIVAAYVWDYAQGMEFMRRFWDVAVDVDLAAAELDEARRFPICDPDRLAALWRDTGLRDVETCPIDVPTEFADFDDLWTPFLGGQGAAPAYLATLPEAQRIAIRERLRGVVPTSADGSIAMTARAWAVKGRVT